MAALDHENLDAPRARNVTAAAVKRAIEMDGTLKVEVTLHFVVDHAAREEIDETTLAELIEDNGDLSIAIDDYRIIAATEE